MPYPVIDIGIDFGWSEELQQEKLFLSKTLAYLLRHGSHREGFMMMPGGFLYADDLLKRLGCTEGQIHHLVTTDTKQRFAMKVDTSGRLLVRANQGHSIQIEGLDLVPIVTEVDPCIHGTSASAWSLIRTQGLSRMNRNHIHFSVGEPGTAGVISGMRNNSEVLIYINMQKALKDGLKFFRSANNVILCPGNEKGVIPPCYFRRVINRLSTFSRYPLDFDSRSNSRIKNLVHAEEQVPCAIPVNLPIQVTAPMTDTPYPTVDPERASTNHVESSQSTRHWIWNEPKHLGKMGLIGGSRTTVTRTGGKRKRNQVGQARAYLKNVCNKHNDRNITATGPYGDVCGWICRKNTKANRKRLQTFWFRLKKTRNEETISSSTLEKNDEPVPHDDQQEIHKKQTNINNDGQTATCSHTGQERYSTQTDKVEYTTISRLLHEVLLGKNERKINETGPYGRVCRLLGWKNSSGNRSLLFTMWKENKGNIRCRIEDSHHHRQSDKTGSGKTVDRNMKRNATCQLRTGPPKKYARVSMETTDITTEVSNSSANTTSCYCVCKSTDLTWKKNGNMVECESCSSWFHLKCLKLPYIPTVSRKQINFICGIGKCSDSRFVVNGKSYISDKAQLDIGINECVESEDKMTVEYPYNIGDTNISKPGNIVENDVDICVPLVIKNTCSTLDIESNIILTRNDIDGFNESKTQISQSVGQHSNVVDKDQRNIGDINPCIIPESDVDVDNAICIDTVMSQTAEEHKLVHQSKSMEEQSTSNVNTFVKKYKHVNKYLDTINVTNSTHGVHFKQFFDIYNSVASLIMDLRELDKKDNVIDEYTHIENRLTQHLSDLDGFNSFVELKKNKTKMVSLIHDALLFLNYARTSNASERKSGSVPNASDIKMEIDYPCNLVNNKLISEPNNKFCTVTSGNDNRNANNDEQQCSSDENATETDDIIACPLSKETMSSILETDIPDKYFSVQIPATASFLISPEDWNNLSKTRKTRSFKRDSWQSLFFEGVKSSNPYCCFQVSYSRLSMATQRSRPQGSLLFNASAHCIFKDCKIKLKIEMSNTETVNLIYSGDMKHAIEEIHNRPIKGQAREKLKREFKSGVKPFAVYLDKFQEIPTQQLLSGNRDGLGKDSRVFAQIAAESRQKGRFDNDVIQSLLELSNDMHRTLEGGFIQKICVSPFYILYWSKAGIELYNERAKHDTLFWDATGSVVRRSDNGKRFLYYELAIRNPLKGKFGIPLTAMLSADQSLSTVVDWICSFRQAEKMRFGHNKNKIAKPKMIISDQAMVFILAALKEFNGETMETFLQRSWKICSGLADASDTAKTLVHLCGSHFMNTSKRYMKKKEIGGYKLNLFMYIIGLLMNSNTVKDAQELLFDIYVTVGSKYINALNRKFYDRLMRKINTFSSTADVNIFDAITESVEQNSSPNPNNYTEEDFQIIGSVSPFRNWGNNLLLQAQAHIQIEKADTIESDMVDKNNVPNTIHSVQFVDYLKCRLIPIFPLWSSVLMGDLSRYSENYQYEATSLDNIFNSFKNVTKTNSTIENRFRILKHISLGNRSQHRLDEFSESLKTSTVGVQKLVALDCLKFSSFTRKSINRRKRHHPYSKNVNAGFKKSAKKTILVEEEWNKSAAQALNLKDKQGKYQKAPNCEIKIKGSISPNNKKITVNHDDTPDISVSNVLVTENKLNIQEEKSNSKCHQPNTKQKKGMWCPMTNLSNTCWMNSVLQALAASDISDLLIEHQNKETVLNVCDDPTDSERAMQAVTNIWKFIKNPKNEGQRVPYDMLRHALMRIVVAITGFTRLNQQDAHEFNSFIFCNSLHVSGENFMQYTCNEKCSQCHRKTKLHKYEGHYLHLDIQNVDNVSVQTLVDDYFSNCNNTRVCDSCHIDTVHHVTDHIVTAVPTTLVVLLERYVSHKTEGGFVITKQHNDIHVSEVLHIDNTVTNCDIVYDLKSVVCHHGEEANSGHYTAVVKANTSYLQMDDNNLLTVDIDSTRRTAYLLIYDIRFPTLPQFVLPFLKCYTSTNVVKNILKDSRSNKLSKKIRNILLEINNDGSSHVVDSNLKRTLALDMAMDASKRNINFFFDRFIQHIFYFDNMHAETLKKEYVDFSTNHIWSCTKCGFIDIQPQNRCFISVNKFSVSNIVAFLSRLQGEQERLTKTCKCLTTPSVFFMSLPGTFVVQVNDNQGLEHQQVNTIDLAGQVQTAYDIGNLQYNLKSILYHKNGVYVTLIQGSLNNNYDCNEFSTPACGIEDRHIYLFYSRSLGFHDPETELKSMFRKPENVYTGEMKIINVANVLHGELEEKTLFKTKLTKEFFSTINDTYGCLTSANINVYMSLLAKQSSDRVHAVDSGWYGKCLVKDGNPQSIKWRFSETESKKVWFSNDFIVIPINEHGSHWTLVIVDIQKKLMIYSDSFGHKASGSYVCYQLWRYICHEALVHSGLLLSKDEWGILCYSDTLDFPLQSNGSSCGVYVCAVAKAVLTKRRLPNEPNLYRYRKLMCYEIQNGTILDMPQTRC